MDGGVTFIPYGEPVHGQLENQQVLGTTSNQLVEFSSVSCLFNDIDISALKGKS